METLARSRAYVLARLQVEIGDNEQAMTLLEAAFDKDAPHEELLGLLAALKLKSGDTAAAEALYRLGDQRFPLSDRWIKGLARIYLQSGESAKLTAVLRRWSDTCRASTTSRSRTVLVGPSRVVDGRHCQEQLCSAVRVHSEGHG